ARFTVLRFQHGKQRWAFALALADLPLRSQTKNIQRSGRLHRSCHQAKLQIDCSRLDRSPGAGHSQRPAGHYDWPLGQAAPEHDALANSNSSQKKQPMPKKRPQLRRRRSAKSIGSRKTKRKKSRPAKLTLKERLARAKKLEVLDAGKPTFQVRPRALTVAPDNVSTAPPPVITGSVGRWEKGARNLQADVETVQRLLQTSAQSLQAPELDPKGVDGKIAGQSAKSNTVAAIEAFQKRSNISIDGLIEPGGQTWQALLQAAGPLQNDDSQTYIQENSVNLDDPDHWLTLTWTWAHADSLETGPFLTSHS